MSHELAGRRPGSLRFGKIVHGIVEIKIVVEHAIHKVFQVVDADMAKQALDYVGDV